MVKYVKQFVKEDDGDDDDAWTQLFGHYDERQMNSFCQLQIVESLTGGTEEFRRWRNTHTLEESQSWRNLE